MRKLDEREKMGVCILVCTALTLAIIALVILATPDMPTGVYAFGGVLVILATAISSITGLALMLHRGGDDHAPL